MSKLLNKETISTVILITKYTANKYRNFFAVENKEDVCVFLSVCAYISACVRDSSNAIIIFHNLKYLGISLAREFRFKILTAEKLCVLHILN